MSEIEMYRGDYAEFQGTIAATDDENVVDLTGCKVYFTAKDSATDPDASAIIQLDSEFGGVLVSAPTTGVYVVQVSPYMTEGLVMANHQHELLYDVQLRTASSYIYTVDIGTLTVLEDITIRKT